MIVYLDRKATKEDVQKASEEFGDYIKIVVDIENNILAMGGKLHADAEKVLIENGSSQENIWGGGYSVTSRRIDTQAVINIRPRQGNDSMEILDADTRRIFIEIAERFMK